MLSYKVSLTNFRLIVLSIFFLIATQTCALDGSLAIQGGVAQAFQSNGNSLPSNFGPTGYAYLDFNLDPSFSLGLGTGLTGLMNGDPRLWVDGTLLQGRWSPWAGSSWSPYLMAGFGFRPLRDLMPQHSWWDGNYQGAAGIGLRHNLMQGMDLDLTLFYDINSPQPDPLNQVGIRAGFAFPFGSESAQAVATQPVTAQGGSNLVRMSETETTQPETAQAETVVEAKSHQVSSSNNESKTNGGSGAQADESQKSGEKPGAEAPDQQYVVKKGDCLWLISRHAYGHGARWKKIFDANGDAITNPDLIYPGDSLLIPDGINREDKD